MVQTSDILANIVIVSERVDIRGAVREAVKEVGAQNVVSLASLEEAYEYFSTAEQTPGWIFTTLENSANYNWKAFLASKLESPEMLNTLTTMLFTEDDLEHINLAYELGITSHIKLPFTHNVLISQLNSLIDNGERNQWQLGHVAAINFREYLNDTENFAELVKLEQSFVDRFPADASCLVKLAEAEFSNENPLRAKKIVNRAAMLGGDIETAAKQLKDLIVADEGDGEQKEEFAASFEIKNCMIVDSDSSNINMLKEALTAIGVTEFIEAETGIEAMEKLDPDNAPDLLIFEWKLPKLSGMQFVQRFLSAVKKDVITIICSSSLKEQDLPLIKELRISGSVAKPVNAEELQALIVNRVTASKTSRDAETIYHQMHLAVSNEDKNEAIKIYGLYQALEEKDEIMGLLIEAEFNYIKGFYEEAKKAAFTAFAKSGGSLAANALVTKILLKLKHPLDAVKNMAWAQNESPFNLERVCKLAEVHSEMGHEKEAQENLELAEKIDKDAPITRETTARVALNSGDTDRVKAVLSDMDSLAPLITYMNNRAVMLVRDTEVERGIKLYKDALGSMPEGRVKEEAAIQYNLGLAYAKMNRLKEASEMLGSVKKENHERLFTKAQKLQKTVNQAIQKNVKLNFSSSSKAAQSGDEVIFPMPASSKPGTLGLHLIYSTDQLEADEVQQALKSMKKMKFPEKTKDSA